MGMNRYVHLGAYIEIPARTVTVNRSEVSCPTEKCSNHKKRVNAMYCQHCGSEIKTLDFKVSEQERVSHYILDDDIKIDDDEFMWVETDIHTYLLSNYTDCGSIPIGELMGPVTQEIISSKVDEFKAKHQSDVNKIERFYKEKFPVQFGVIEYYM